MYNCLAIFVISIGVVLGLALDNSFDTPIRSLLCYPVDLLLGKLIGTLMGPLLVN